MGSREEVSPGLATLQRGECSEIAAVLPLGLPRSSVAKAQRLPLWLPLGSPRSSVANAQRLPLCSPWARHAPAWRMLTRHPWALLQGHSSGWRTNPAPTGLSWI